jgi:hypothetical protein
MNEETAKQLIKIIEQVIDGQKQDTELMLKLISRIEKLEWEVRNIKIAIA